MIRDMGGVGRWLAIGCALTVLVGCERSPSGDSRGRKNASSRAPAPLRASAYLLLAQAQFSEEKQSDGTSKFTPGAAKLTLVGRQGEQWASEVIEDPESNVFHGARPFDLPGEVPGILTIGGNPAPLPALLKIWRRSAQGWQAVVLARAAFGGASNRFRGVAIGDVTGDGVAEIVVATHDRGVVAVLRQPEHGGNWEVIVIDQAPNTFVHEVEVGDIDGDGLNEIFATPSAPNKMNLKLQPGKVVMYRFDGKGWPRQIIEALEDRHAKEILLADVEGRGRPDLYAVLERSLGKVPGTTGEDDNAILKRYRFSSGGFTGTVIARLPDVSCRFLNAGDVDADGQAELVASCGKAGIWMVKPAAGEWSLRPIDRDSESIEHATALADLDGDGHLEIYVAADKQRKLRRYVWNGEGFDRSDLLSLAENDLTFDLTVCQDTRCVSP